MGCGELNFSACLAFFFFPSLFFSSLLTQSHVSHIFISTPCHAGCHLSRILCIFTIFPHLAGRRLLSHRWPCSCVVLHLGGKGLSGVILSLLPGRYLVITITVGGRPLARGDQTGGGMSGWTVLGGQPRRCQHTAWAGKEAFSACLPKYLFFLQETCREINNPGTFLVFEKQFKKKSENLKAYAHRSS